MAQFVFFGGLFGHERFVYEAGLIAADGLERVFDAEKIFCAMRVVFRGLR